MKAVKGKLLKNLKTIKAIGYLKPERILQVNALDGYLYTSPPKPTPRERTPLVSVQEEPRKLNFNCGVEPEPEVIDVAELMKDLEDEEMGLFDDGVNDKENTRPDMNSKGPDDFKGNVECRGSTGPKNEALEASDQESSRKKAPLSETDALGFRRPDLDSGTLFDPNLLAAFQQAVMEVKAQETERIGRLEEKIWEGIDEEPPLKARKIEEKTDPLLEFEEKCPPGGENSVILYTTGLRGIRKTFEDCHSLRSLLENLRVLFYERDISMHSGFKEELWKVLGGRIVPPRLFVKGRYIGGAEEVLGLHEQGKLRPLFEGIPTDNSQDPCEGCIGIRFIVCFNCNGSRKIMPEGDGEPINCSECNENGLIICPFCC